MALKTRSIVSVTFGLVIVVVLGIVAFRPEPVPVDIAQVTRGDLQVTVNADGKTRIREIYEVAAPMTGTALRSPVRVGDPVVEGETVVAVVEPAAPGLLDIRSRIQAQAAVREAEAALHQARSLLREAQEELEQARREFERSRELVARGAASETRLETAERQLGIKEAAQAAAVSGLEMAKGALDRARAALIEPGSENTSATESCCVRLTAPVDGEVLDIDVISERPVTAGTRLLSLGKPDDLEIVADLLSADAVRVEVGDRAIVERWGGDGVLEARIARIEPAAYTKVSALGVEEQRVDVVLDLLTPADRRAQLGDGFAVFLRIVEWEGQDVLRVPLSALFREGDSWAVFVADEGRAALRKVTTGRRNAQHAQILDGIEAGERVIMHPSSEIEHGTRIVLRPAP